MHIKLTVGYPNWNGIRQTPGSTGSWNGHTFSINQSCEECDAWVVLQSSKGLLARETTYCPPQNVILITREPPDMMTWGKNYLQQFGLVVTCHDNLNHQNVLLSQHGQTWHLSKHSFDELLNITPGEKPKLLSIICSNKTYTEGHRLRLKLIDALKSRFEDLDVFGRGINPISDKWDGIYPYQYHIVLENGSFPHYWTEKLTDAYLGYALPIYSGCPNLNDYFSSKAFVRIDPGNIDQTISIIEKTIESDQYKKSLPEIVEARNLVLFQYNLFPTVVDLCCQLSGRDKRKVLLRPDFEFSSQSFLASFKKVVSRASQIPRRIL